VGRGGPRVAYDRARLAALVEGLAGQIATAHPEGLVLVGLLPGGAYFLADLVRELRVPVTVDFLALSRYGTGLRVEVRKGLDVDVRERDVVVASELVDTGLTLDYTLRLLATARPASIEVCALFDRPARRIVRVPLRYVGAVVEDVHLVGYGLDVGGLLRNLPQVITGNRPVLASDPGACVEAGFGG
jgi:hypoxanthine phosphoribosyltransferase